MEITLQDAEVVWQAKHLKKQVEDPRAPLATTVTVLLPSPSAKDSDQRPELSLPCKISVPPSDLEEGAEENEDSVLNRHATFNLRDGGELVATHALKLRDCIPVLADGAIHWTQPVLHKDNKAVLGLLPPIAGCIIGIVATSPVWVPLTVLVGVMGSPIWFVAGVAASLIVVFSVISTIVTVKLVRSERVKSACQHFLRSPQGQLLLFEGTPGEKTMSPSVLSARAKEYVLANPSRKLVASLAIDFLGNATFVVPGLGEMADVLWAPVSAKMVDTLYSESSPHAKYVAFVEELLPFTDFIPTATLAWLKENMSSEELDNLLSKFRRA
ncbi:hypothetical protein BBJ28_00005655 [Nothophytophthora sp. Chile5]|nr:hypothetical protein BBJ28_00005655 [Nothophytophthora sp. Chile5]